MIESAVDRIVADILRTDGSLELRGLGTFSLRQYATQREVFLKSSLRELREASDFRCIDVRAPKLEAELVARGETHATAAALVEALFTNAVRALVDVSAVAVGELGILVRRDEPARTLHLPTGDTIVPARFIVGFRATEAMTAMVNAREPLPTIPVSELESLFERYREPVTTADSVRIALDGAGVPLLPASERERRLSALDAAAGGRWPEPWRTLASYQLRGWFCRTLVEEVEEWMRTENCEPGVCVVLTEFPIFVDPALPGRGFNYSPQGERSDFELGPWLAKRLFESHLDAVRRGPPARALNAIGMQMVDSYL